MSIGKGSALQKLVLYVGTDLRPPFNFGEKNSKLTPRQTFLITPALLSEMP